MKTICIKSNNPNALKYLLNTFNSFNYKEVYFSCHNFKTFNNFFIHYKGTDEYEFLQKISNIISHIIIDLYQNTILKNLLNKEYFYFTSNEIEHILDICNKNILENNIFTNLENILYEKILDFLEKNKKFYLKGFITFRLKKYIEELEKIIDEGVKEYLIEKEYNEFVSILQLYVSSEPCKCEFVHLIYNSHNPILIDKNNNIIKTELNLLNMKYLSDISFSSCDIILNTLLNLLPKKIYIHMIDRKFDDFISTIQVIFKERISICTDCAICKIYKC